MSAPEARYDVLSISISLVIAEIAMSRVGDDPGAVGFQETDCRSFDKARLPSFFLYDAEPIVGVILERMGRSFAMHQLSGSGGLLEYQEKAVPLF